MILPPPAIPPALSAMAAYPQWINWQLVDRPGKPKPDKVPTDPNTHLPIDAQNPFHWMDAATAVATAIEKKLGLGFVFTEPDPFFFLDIDDCATPQGQWAPHALQLLSAFPGAAIETSCSGTGLHVFGRCPRGFVHSNKNKELNIELYGSKRYVAIGTGAIGDANTDCTAGFTAVASQYFPPRAHLTSDWTTEAEPESGVPDDDTAIEKARSSGGSAAVRFGNKASFNDLWEANEMALAVSFPDPNRAYDASSADLAMAAHLAFWTGRNCEQIQRIMLRSGLARDKWERDDYIQGTILKAISGDGGVYRSAAHREKLEDARIAEAIATQPTPVPPPPPPPPSAANAPVPPNVVPLAVPPAAPSGMKDGYPYNAPDKVQRMFERYIYVTSVDGVLSPKGIILNPSKFRNQHEFRNEKFPLGLAASSKTTSNAWKAYQEAEYLRTPTADALCFRPGDARTLFQDGEDTLANIWRDPKPRRMKGDPSRFVRHVRTLLPNGDDADQLLAYMAACVQHQGKKFAWCPLIQGVQGNGKSMFGVVLGKVIGEKFVHNLQAESIRSQFNEWAQGNSLIVVDDVHFKGSGATLERVKPLITSGRMAIERKGLDQTTEDVCANFLMTTNHKDAIPLDPDERRWAVFFCAQQSKRDRVQSGLTDEYFVSLWGWLEDKDGFAIVAEYLWTYDIPYAMNPAAGRVTAPETTTHQEALSASKLAEAQFLEDAIETEGPGFKEGWVSTHAASTVLRENGVRTTPQKIAVELAKLGYVKHPGLEGGKTPRSVSGEGKRTRLWVREGHISWHLRGNDVVSAYEKAQGYPPVGSNVVPIR